MDHGLLGCSAAELAGNNDCDGRACCGPGRDDNREKQAGIIPLDKEAVALLLR